MHEFLDLYVRVSQTMCFPLISLSLKYWTYFIDWNILVFSLAHIIDIEISATIFKAQQKIHNWYGKAVNNLTYNPCCKFFQ